MGKKICYMLLTLLVMSGIFRTDVIYANELTPITVEIELVADNSSGMVTNNNLDIINEAFEKANDSTLLTVKIKTPGKYYVGGNTGGRSIKIRSNTVFDLNGSTIVRAGSLMANLMQNCDFSGDTKVGGYALSKNITVKNGTLDGTGGAKDKDYNLVNIGHASNVTFSNVAFSTCRGSHLLEFSGCSDCLVENCSFTGYTGRASSEEGEALQLDISYNGTKTSWNGVFKSDKTVCKNITVTGCTFKDYPSGVGNHHSLTGGICNTGIKIQNNTFTNTLSAKSYAIWCYDFRESEVSGNTITGGYKGGIQISGGDVDVYNNIIGSVDRPVNYEGINFTEANNYVVGKSDTRIDEKGIDGNIIGNQVYTKGKLAYPLSIFSGSVVSNISSNNLISETDTALVISGKGTSVGVIKENTIKSVANMAILIADSAKMGNILGNTITGNKTAVQISSKATAGTIGAEASPNVIVSNTMNGIVVTNKSTKIKGIQFNSITSQNMGISIADSAKVSTNISNNSIIAKNQGIQISSKANGGTISKNTVSSKSKEGIIVTGKGSYAKSIENNTITAKKSTAIYVSKCSVDTISGNKMDSNKLYGIGICSSSNVGTIAKNVITKYGKNAIYVTSGSVVKNIKSNQITNGNGDAIYLSNAKVTGVINENIISGCKKGGSGIYVTSTGKISKVQKNKISKCAGYGICIQSSGKMNVTKNVLKQNKKGAIKCNGKGTIQKK